MAFFHVLSLSKIDREKVFADVLDRKEAFEDYKEMYLLKKHESRIFRKGLVHRFHQKFKISLTLTFMENRSRKSIWCRSS